jgi:ElaB/YqjD/DUF883 family membrane-anchored ribosome-binding protein
MDQESDLSAQRPEQIRCQIEETRSELTAKLEALEQKVRDTVAEAKTGVIDIVETIRQSVDDSVQTVKGTLHDAVDSVKHALDLGRQVERRPWTMLAGSVAAGYLLSRLAPRRQPVNEAMTRSSDERFSPHSQNGRRLPDFNGTGTVASPTPASAARPRVPDRGLFGELTEKFAPEIQQLKALAIGSAMALATDMIKQSVAPPLGQELAGVMDRVTSKLGGVPLSGRVPDLPPEGARATNNARLAPITDDSGRITS